MEKLGEAYLDRPRNLNIPTTPGRQLWFNGGKATLFDVRDVIHVLRRDDLTLYLSERYRDWWKDWLDACGEHQPARAKIEVEGVVHEPPYAMLLAQAPDSVTSEYEAEAQGAVAASEDATDEEVSLVGSDEPSVQEPQGPVLAAPLGRRGPGKPPKWVSNGEDRAAVDPDGVEAAGGSDPLDPDIAWDNNHPPR